MWTEMSDLAIIRLVGERLKALRIRMEMTQEELARQAGTNILTVANVEKGRSVTVANLIRIMCALDMLENLEEAFPAPPNQSYSVEEVARPTSEARAETGKRGGFDVTRNVAVSGAGQIIKQIVHVASQWEYFASETGVPVSFIRSIQKELRLL